MAYSTPGVISQRLNNQKLASPGFQQPVAVVRWLGAVQAQDYNAARWALALRMRQATNAAVEEAYNEGQILRTHLMRPTWHFVAPDDIRWLLQLTAPRVNIKCGPYYRKLELDDAIFKRSNKILARALKGGKHLTRAVLGKSYWSARVAPVGPQPRHSAYLLPAYDEYTVAYKDRQTLFDGKPLLEPQGLLGPIVVIDGKFAGTWKATSDKKSVTITLNLSRALKKAETVDVAKAAERYAAFLGLPQVAVKATKGHTNHK